MLIYDGDCGMCTQLALWAEARLPSDVEVAPWQAIDLDSVDLTVDEVATAVYWRGRDGSLHRGHLAVGAVLVAFGGWWKPIGRLIRVPPVSWLAAGVYRVVAKNRYRFPGSTCAIPQDN